MQGKQYAFFTFQSPVLTLNFLDDAPPHWAESWRTFRFLRNGKPKLLQNEAPMPARFFNLAIYFKASALLPAAGLSLESSNEISCISREQSFQAHRANMLSSLVSLAEICNRRLGLGNVSMASLNDIIARVTLRRTFPETSID